MSLKLKALWAVLVFCMAGGTFWAQEKKREAQGSGLEFNFNGSHSVPSSRHYNIARRRSQEEPRQGLPKRLWIEAKRFLRPSARCAMEKRETEKATWRQR